MAVRGGWEQLRELDRRAATLARSAGALRLLLGEVLAYVDSRSAHHSFGFSSLGAYVTERCQRGVTWARDAVRVARAVESFPNLRAAALQGFVTWSALGWALRGLRPFVAARAALAEGALGAAERVWLSRAREGTVRELAAMVRQQEGGAVGATRGSSEVALHPFLRRLPRHVLTLTVRAETAWWFECARGVYERSVCDCPGIASSVEGFMGALLAEARTALEGWAPLDDEGVERWGAYVRMLGEWRDESERRCDAQRAALSEVGAVELSELDDVDVARMTLAELDERVRRLSLALGRRDLELGMLAEWSSKAEAWRRLGFASEAHYVRERMGCSYSQWKARRALARKLGARGMVRTAFLRGEIGLEAALLLLRVARDGRSERSWVARARERTCKHLREEVRAAELGEQQFGRAPFPPSEDAMRRVLAIEGRVKSGAALLEVGTDGGAVDDDTVGGDTAGGDVSGGDVADDGRGVAERGRDAEGAPAGHPSDDGSRMSVGTDEARGASTELDAVQWVVARVASRAWMSLRGELAAALETEPDVRRGAEGEQRRAHRRGQVRLRLRLERDTLLEFRALERLFRRRGGGDFLEFLCRHFLEVWAPAMLTDVKYAHVYRRDAFTCSSPVCSRHDVQPHHLRFRSQGGGEEVENLTALCTWCHLDGVHGGRLRVSPPASAMRWRIGVVRPFDVRGRSMRREAIGWP